ncbi:hypothetical protein EEL32_06915 [Brevibacillus laterosporus]|nr:hypothetical protein EEL32_06915 [Brevibacillus laterosporus]
MVKYPIKGWNLFYIFFLDDLITFFGIICNISLVLSIPVSILVGFVGRSEIVIGCMNCGFKWTPAKKK